MEYLKRAAIGLMALTVVGTGLSVSLSVAAPEAAVAKSRKKKARAKSNNIVRVAQKDGSYTTLIEAINKAGLAGTLASGGPFTVFAPSDAAFAKLPKAEVEELLSDRDKLREVLKYHVVKGRVSAEDLAQKRSIPTIQGEFLMVDSKDDGGTIVVDGAIVTKPDIKAGNGIIHEIDFLLVPERGK
ncbi:MAG: fasciclin domain-containing protein [Cyanobacteriota/Melainabacteria group bacterium]